MSYRYGPLEQPRLMLGLRPGQALLVAVFVPLIVGSFFLGELLGMGVKGAAAPVVFLGVGALLTFAPLPGRNRGLDELGPGMVKHLWLRLRGRDMWLTGAYRKGQEVGFHVGRSLYLKDFESKPPFLEQIELLAVADSESMVSWGIAHDKQLDQYIAVLPCVGPGTALLDPDEVRERQEAYAEIIATYGQREPLNICAIGWTERIVPDQGEDVIRHMLTQFDKHQVGDHDPMGAARSNYRKLVDGVGPVSQQHELFLELVLDAKVAGGKMARLGEGNRYVGAAMLLHQEAEELRRMLEGADITAGPLLEPRELAAAIRVSFSPDVRQACSLMERNGAEKGIEVENAWPSMTRARMTHFEADGWYFRTYFVRAWPTMDVGPEYLWPLLRGTRAARTFSVVMEPISLARSMSEWNKRSIDLKAQRARKEKIGQQITPEDEAAERAHEQLGEQLADGFVQMRFQGFITVAAPSLQELESECAKVTTAAGQARLRLELMVGQQEVGMRATLPLGRGR